MTAQFGLTVIVYAVGVAVICAACSVAGRLRPRPVVPALVILQISVVAQAAIDGVLVLRGQHGDNLATHLGYLVISLVIVPIVVAAVRLDPGRWASAALAFGCLLVAVVSLRLHQTMGTSHG